MALRGTFVWLVDNWKSLKSKTHDCLESMIWAVSCSNSVLLDRRVRRIQSVLGDLFDRLLRIQFGGPSMYSQMARPAQLD